MSTTLLIVLDGWGHGESGPHNAIEVASTPNWDHYWSTAPHTLLACSGEEVGLPSGQMGNSEVGHMTIGAGRVVHQDLTRIDRSIEDGSFFRNPNLRLLNTLGHDQRVHVLGLLSPGGIHSHESQIHSLVQFLASAGTSVAVHAFLDGRDTPPRNALASLESMEATLRGYSNADVASICGRYYAMDRDNRWGRTQAAYDMLTRTMDTHQEGDSISLLEQAYRSNESDEFVKPVRTRRFHPIKHGDAVVFMNFRADRARQLSRAFVLDEFKGFVRAERPLLSKFVTLTPYSNDIHSDKSSIPAVEALFDHQLVHNSFGECLAKQELSQLRLAESEKAPHVTYFFSGGREAAFKGETRCIVESPRVATYDLCPRMSADEITDQLVRSVQNGKYTAIICNFANGDMVGHTGDFEAARKAVECLDECLGRIFQVCEANDCQCFVTSDHGNVENMLDHGTNQPNTAHTTNLVPLLYVGPTNLELSHGGSLADVAPTLLDAMNLPIPSEMSGRSLVAGTQTSIAN